MSTVVEAGREIAERVPRRRRSLLALAGSTDHKHVGLLTMGLSFFWFLAAGVLALVMRTELAQSGMQVVSPAPYNHPFTMHGSTMFFLFAIPISVAIGVYLVPLQVGAAEIQWPRLALLGLWLLLPAGLIMFSGFLTSEGAAKAGWTAFYPLSDSDATPGISMDLWVIGAVLSTLSTI